MIQRTICNTEALIEEAVDWAASQELLANDIETIPHITKAKKPQPYVMTVNSYSGIDAQGVISSYAFQFTRQKSSLYFEHPLAKQALLASAKINANPIRKTLHNGVYDAAWYLRYNIPLRNYAYDSMTMWWARYPDLPKTLSYVSSILLDDYNYWKMGRKEEDFTNHTLYAMADTEFTLRNTIQLLRWMVNDNAMRRNFHFAHLRCLTGLAMSMKGMLVDQEVFTQMESELREKADKANAKLKWLIADDDFNFNSPPQKKELFYELLGAQPRNAKGRILTRTTGNAKVSTGAIALRSFKSEHPILRRIVETLQKAQEPAKQISNVIGLEFSDSRFRTGYDGIGTTTSRLSSRKDAFGFGGNAQNIRKKFRRFLRAEKDACIIEIDFSAADDVFVSYESEEKKKIEIIEGGYDTHSYNAANIFFPNWKYERVVSGKREDSPDYEAVTHPITGIRQITKKLTHGANYLMAGHTLLNSAGREAIVGAAKRLGFQDAGIWGINRLVEFCEWLDSQYRIFYPRFARAGSGSFYADLSLGLRRHRSFITVFNYRQKFTGDPMADSTLRACAATVGQANTAGRVNMAMSELDQGIRLTRFRDGDAPDRLESALVVNERDFGMSLRLQTHDSLTSVTNLTHPKWEDGVERFFHVMRRPIICKGREFTIGIEADVSIHWGSHVHTVSSAADIREWSRNL